MYSTFFSKLYITITRFFFLVKIFVKYTCCPSFNLPLKPLYATCIGDSKKITKSYKFSIQNPVWKATFLTFIFRYSHSVYISIMFAFEICTVKFKAAKCKEVTNTISLIMMRVGPNFLWIRNTSKNLKYMTSRERAYIRLARVKVSDGWKWRIKSATMSNRYDSRSTTFQKS